MVNTLWCGSTQIIGTTVEELNSGQFGAAGTEAIINNSDGYSYFKFEVGPGSSQYLSYIKFQVRA